MFQMKYRPTFGDVSPLSYSSNEIIKKLAYTTTIVTLFKSCEENETIALFRRKEKELNCNQSCNFRKN